METSGRMVYNLSDRKEGIFMRTHDASAAVKQRRPTRCIAFLYILLAALADTLIVEMFNHKTFTGGFASLWRFLSHHPLAFAVDVLLVLLTLLPALLLRRRVFWCVLVSAVWLMGGAVNGFILLNRMTPFTTADLTVLNTGLDTLPNYLSTGYIILLAAAVALLLAGLVLLLWKGPRNQLPRRRRVLAGLAALAVTAAALTGCWQLAFRLDQLSTVFSNLAFAYEDFGFSYCFLQTWLNKGIRQPTGYSESDVQRILRETEPSGSAGDTTAQTGVNVVYVQLESFMDPADIQGLELSEDPLPFWHTLEEEFSSGYLTVPVVGAGTANTEFEMLTGMSSRVFGPGEYPYKTCLQNNTVESVAYDLSALGYATHAIHNHRATFYTRNIVYANLGFDDFTSLEYMPLTQKTPKGWCRDYILTDQILNAMDATESQPDLVFTVSVQGHGSYPKTPLLEHPAVTVTACPDHINASSVEYYVNQIHEMDQFVEQLVNALSQREEKTVLVLYGDHLPSLNLRARDMASDSLFKTRYVVWNNFGLEENDQDVYAFQLSADVLGQLGITEGIMNRFHQRCQQQLTYRTDLRKLQYDVLYGQRYLYGGETPYAPTDMQMGCVPIRITNMFERGGVWYIQGENFSPYCEVTVDGNLLKTDYICGTLLTLEEDPGVLTVDDLYISVVDTHHEILSDTE